MKEMGNPFKKTIKFKWLISFHTLVEEGSFLLAAQKLDQSQQALSNSIARLETLVGIKLLDRQAWQPSGGSLTPEGKRFYESSRKILQKLSHIDEMVNILNQPSYLSGPLSLALQPLWIQHFGKLFFQYLHQESPNLDFHLTGLKHEQQIYKDLLDESLDLAILTPTQIRPNLNYMKLGYSRCILVQATALSSSNRPKNWQQLKFIRYLRHNEADDHQTFWPESDYPRQIALESNHFLQAIHWCLEGHGCLYLPYDSVKHWLDSGELAEIELALPQAVDCEITAVWNPKKLNQEKELHLLCAIGKAYEMLEGPITDLPKE